MSNDKRVSDKRMNELFEQFDQHVERFEQHEREEGDRFNKLVKAQQANADAVANLTRQVSSLVGDTKEIIQLHKDFQGTARIGRGIQNFMMWLLKWGTIGVGIVAMLNIIIDHFRN